MLSSRIQRIGFSPTMRINGEAIAMMTKVNKCEHIAKCDLMVQTENILLMKYLQKSSILYVVILNEVKNLLFNNDLHCMRSFTTVQDDTLLGLLQEPLIKEIFLNG